MNKFLKMASAAALLAFASNASAVLITVDFESETAGAKANGYTVGGLTFTDTVGNDLRVQNWGVQSDGLGLAVFDDSDGGGLKIGIDGLADFITMDFGNDDPGFSQPGDLVYLEAYLGGGLVGTSQVVMNRDDIMNQAIAFGGALFDEVFVVYTDPNLGGFTNVGGAPIGLIELVDNIAYNKVPEPGIMALLATGLLGIGGIGVARRKRA